MTQIKISGCVAFFHLHHPYERGITMESRELPDGCCCKFILTLKAYEVLFLCDSGRIHPPIRAPTYLHLCANQVRDLLYILSIITILNYERSIRHG